MNDKVVIIDKRPTTNDQRPDLCPQVSVHVLIYNGSWERVRATLNSVIMQKGIDFELIIVDDCSKENLSDKIKDFLSRHNFTNYRLIVHEKNLGTVATCLEAAKESRAEYMRGLGQGDMFFDEYALRDSYDYMLKTDAEVMISKAVFYHAFSKPIEIFAHRRYPQDIKAYDDPDDLRESYLLHGDNVSGATVMYKREVFAQYMNEAVTTGMKYIEDLMLQCMVFDKRRIKFLDRNVIFYEYGAGISTSKVKDDSIVTQKISLGKSNDGKCIRKLLLKRCQAEQSYFTQKLEEAFNRRDKTAERRIAMRNFREKVKEKLGIAAIPLVFLWRIFKTKTDTNVSTDFANLCMTRE